MGVGKPGESRSFPRVLYDGQKEENVGDDSLWSDIPGSFLFSKGLVEMSFCLSGLGRAPLFFWFLGYTLGVTQGEWRAEVTLKHPGADTAALPQRKLVDPKKPTRRQNWGEPYLPYVHPSRGFAPAKNVQTKAMTPEVTW